MWLRLFAGFMRRRWLLGAIILVLTGVALAGAARVKPDYRVESLFPVWDDARTVYDRFKVHFPFEDGRAFVFVEADDILSAGGLTRIAQLEEDLRHIPNVLDVEGPMSVNDIVERDDWVAIERLFPDELPDPAVLATRADIARSDPLFAYSLAHPDGRVVCIRVSLTPASAADERLRTQFLAHVRTVVSAHQVRGQRIVASGIPVIRARYNELIALDNQRLAPLALLVVLVLLAVSFRHLGAVIAGAATIIVSVLWTVGAMGLMGLPLTVIGAVIPVVIIIISVSDTVHVVTDFLARRREGAEVKDAVAHAAADSAVPCLLTEFVLACGFLSLLAINIVAVHQFGLVTAVGMILTWLANMTVLPFLLSFTRSAGVTRGGKPSWVVGKIQAFVEWSITAVSTRPRIVAAVAGALIVASLAVGSRVSHNAYAFDGLRPEQPLYQDLRFAERAAGGSVPIAVFYEVQGEGDDPVALEPALVRSADRAAAMLEGFPEIKQATSIADPVRKAHRILSGGAEPDLPGTRALVAQEVTLIDDGRLVRDLVAFDRRHLAVMAMARDAGARRVHEMFVHIDGWVAEEQKRLDAELGPGRARVRATGQLRIFNDVNAMLVDGLLGSLAGAFVVSLVVFCAVLRSWRLGLIGLVPNVTPLAIVLAMMWIAGIPLNPTSAMAFSTTLVIADDDTIQFLARFRRHFDAARERAAREPGLDIHLEACRSCMREVGLPMFLTTASVSAGFLLLLAAQLQGAAHLGLIIGTTLFAAVFADLFLAPLLILHFRPRL
jgi:hypothetical protein